MNSDPMHLYRIYAKFGTPKKITCACGITFVTYPNGYGEICTTCNSCNLQSMTKLIRK